MSQAIAASGVELPRRVAPHEALSRVLWRPRPGRWLAPACIALGGLLVLSPFAGMVCLALGRAPDLALHASASNAVRWDNFLEIWRVIPLARFMLNSLFVAGSVTVLRVSISALCAYALARMRFRGRDLLLYCMLLGVLVPTEARVVPSFVFVHWLGWLDTYAVQILPRTENALTVLLLRQYFLSLPRELEDAARIDGCGPFRVFLHVALPLSKPVLAVAAIMTFNALWNDYAWPLIMTHSTRMKPMQVGLALLSEQRRHSDLGLLMAASLVSVIPVLLLFYGVQRLWTNTGAWTGLK